MPKKKVIRKSPRKLKKKAYAPFVINQSKNLITYSPQGWQSGFFEKIYLHGFSALPSGFRKDGKGFTGYPSFLIKTIQRHFNKKVEFHVLKIGRPKVENLKHKAKITFEYNALFDFLGRMKEYHHDRNVRSNDTVAAFLKNQFPKQFKSLKSQTKSSVSYQKDQIARTLGKKDILKNLSQADVDRLADFYPRFLKSKNSKISRTKRLVISQETKTASESIYLGNLIKEFERRLKVTTQSEQSWQEFFRDYILLFNTNYSGIIEKKNISLSGDYPDFMLVNVYEYLDIYEIKKPSTPLLSKDSSRSNYYWHAEIGKAISQVENYIYELQRHEDAFINDVLKSIGTEIRVVKPRAYIIAGTRSQLSDRCKQDDFRLLNNSLKNVEVILYDDFLKNLKNLLSRLKK